MLLQSVLVIAVLTQRLTVVCGSDDEIRLLRDLFDRSGYNPLLRPVKNLSDTLSILFEVALLQIVSLDERNQIMKTNVWLQLYWYDKQLKWNPEDYGGIEIVRIIPNKAWRPDIVLFNNADGKYEVSYVSNVLINSDSLLSWVPPAIYRSTCTIDVEYFPFDEQVCEMQFGSWTFNAQEITYDWLIDSEICLVQLKDYVTSGVWDVMQAYGKMRRGPSQSEEDKTYVVYYLRIRRKSLFYTVNLIIPCVLISFLTICIFYLPVVEGEKVTMSISLLLALVVFLLLVSKILPATSDSIPLISRYLLFTFILNIFATMSTVIIINLNFRTHRTHHMPVWITFLFLNLLPKLLFMRPPDHVVERLMRRKLKLNSGSTGSLTRATRNDAEVTQLCQSERSLGNVSSSARPLLLHETGSKANTGQTTFFSDDMVAVKHASYGSWSSVMRLTASSNSLNGPPASSSHAPNAASRPREGPGGRRFQSQISDPFAGRRTATVFNTPVKARRASHTPYWSSPNLADVCTRTPKSTGSNSKINGVSAPPPAEKKKKEKCSRSSFHTTLQYEVNATVEALNFMITHLEEEVEYQRVQEEWTFVAAVIDRVHLILFLVVTIYGTITFFLKAPYVLEFVDQQAVIEQMRLINKTEFCADSIQL